MYKRGDIVLIPFPFADLTGTKIRPALVVSTMAYEKENGNITVAMITSVNAKFFHRLEACATRYASIDRYAFAIDMSSAPITPFPPGYAEVFVFPNKAASIG